MKKKMDKQKFTLMSSGVCPFLDRFKSRELKITGWRQYQLPMKFPCCIGISTPLFHVSGESPHSSSSTFYSMPTSSCIGRAHSLQWNLSKTLMIIRKYLQVAACVVTRVRSAFTLVIIGLFYYYRREWRVQETARVNNLTNQKQAMLNPGSVKHCFRHG